MHLIYIIPPALFLLTGFSLAILSIVKGRRNSENILFALLCIVFSLLPIAFISHFIFHGDTALIMRIERAIHLLYVFIPAVSIAFFYRILQHQNRVILVLSCLLSFALSLFTFTDYYFFGLHEFSWGYIAKGGPAFQFMGIYSIVVEAYLILLSIRKLRTATDLTYRLKLKYLTFSMCSIGALGLGNIPAINGIDFYPVGNFGFIPMLIMAWGIYRHDIIRINQYTMQRIFGSITRAAILVVLATAVGLSAWIFRDYSFAHIVSRTFPSGLPPLISFAVCVFISLIGLQVGENRRESIVFSLAILVYALLSLDIYCNCIVTDRQLGLLISRINHAFLVFMPPLILHTVYLVTGRVRARWLVAVAYGLSCVFAATTHSDLYLSGAYRYSWGFFAQVGPLFNAFSVISTAYLLYSLLILWRAYRDASDANTKRRYLFLLIGTTATGVLTIGNIPAMLGYEIYPAGNFIFIPVVLLTMGIFKYNIAELARLGGTILYYAVLLAVVFAAAIALPEPLRAVTPPLNHVLAFLSIIGFGYGWRITHRRIFGSRMLYLRRKYEDLGHRLSKCRTVPEITEVLCGTLVQTLLSETCAVLLRDAADGSYRARRGTAANPSSHACPGGSEPPSPVPGNHPLLELVFLKRKPIRQEECEEWLLQVDRLLDPADPIRKAAYLVPFFFEDRMLALALLGPKRDGSLYSWDETEFLDRLSLGVGPYLENASTLQNLENLVSERTAALRDSELKYRHIIENARDVIYKSDWQGNFTFVNEAFVRLFGYPREEILRMNYIDAVWPDRRDEESAYYRSQLKNRVPESIRLLPCISKSGEMIWIEQSVRAIFGKDGRIVEFDCIARDITERKKAEEALQASEEKYRLTVEGVDDAIYRLDQRGTFTYMNATGLGKLGYTLEEIQGMKFWECTHPDHRERIMAAAADMAVRKNENLYLEFPIVAKDGTIFWSGQNVTRLVDGGGNVEFYVVARDITERKRLEEALGRSEEKYRNLVDSQLIGYYEVDLNGTFTFCNASMASFLDYTPEELIGKSYRDIMKADSADRALDYFKKVFTGELSLAVVELDMLHRDGHVVYSESYVRIITDEDGVATGFSGVGIDISARRKAEAALRESEELHRMVLDNVDDAVFICGPDGRFIYGNMACSRVSGYQHDEFIGESFLKFIHRDDRERMLNTYTRQLVEDIDTTYHEYRFEKKDGSLAWMSQTTRMVRYQDGDIVFYGIARDMTEKKKAEDERRELEDQKSRFFANVSHEIRTPLTLILSPVESYLQGDFGEVDRLFFENIYRNGLRLLKLINNLLDFAKIEAGRMALRVREIDPIKFMTDYLKSISDTASVRGITLRFETPADPIPGLFADPEKLDRVVMNLLSNALKFTKPGGTVTVRVHTDTVFCHISFEDTGCGIPPDALGKIFDRFSQAGAGEARGSGTGIGLALAKELVGLHGGNITVKSNHEDEHPADHGTTFTVTLLMGGEHFTALGDVVIVRNDDVNEPSGGHRYDGMREMADLRAGTADDTAAVPPAARGNDGEARRTLLIVDDNPDMRSYFSSLLGSDYAIVFAENGAEGLARANDAAPDLIVTDVMMPVMSGLEMMTALKDDEALKNIPVIMITANAEMVNKIAGLKQGADDYLVKPFNSIELMTRIASLIKTHDYQKQIFRRNQDIARELEIARLLQRRLLPGKELDVPGYRAHGTYIPMDAVGGDFYDYRVRDGFIDIFIADVSGHGLPGAFLSTVAKMGLDFIAHRASTNGVLYRLNDLILRSTVLNNFVTAFFCTLNTENNVLRYCNAGHIPPLLFHRGTGEVIELATKGKPLGWVDDPGFEEREVTLRPGDRLCLFTDGVTECMDSDKEFFGDERLRDLITAKASLPPDQLTALLIGELKGFSGSETFDDDVTLVVFDVL